MRNRLIAVAGGLSAAGLVFVASVGLSLLVSRFTDSGFFGICGPYGSEAWIAVIVTLFLGAPVAGVVVGIMVAKRIWRRRSAPVA
jgi:hypothetical protein